MKKLASTLNQRRRRAVCASVTCALPCWKRSSRTDTHSAGGPRV
jgi:hypothetical protein